LFQKARELGFVAQLVDDSPAADHAVQAWADDAAGRTARNDSVRMQRRIE
jgi:hypothetical protein